MIWLDPKNTISVNEICKYDKIVEIDSIIPDTRNEKGTRVFGLNTEKFGTTFEEHGLMQAPTVNSESNLLISGHRRIQKLKETGCTQVPVIYTTAKDEYDEYRQNLVANSYDETPDIGRYINVLTGIEVYEKVHGDFAPVQEKEKLCSESKISYDLFKTVEKIRHGFESKEYGKIEGREHLYEELFDREKNLSITAQYNKLVQSHIANNCLNIFPRDPDLEKIFSNEDLWVKVAKTVQDQLALMDEHLPWFRDVADLQYKTSSIHYILQSFFPSIFNEFSDVYTAEKGPQGSQYDIHFFKDGELVNSLEIKTTKNDNWSSDNPKYGYALLYKTSEELEQCYMCTVWLDNKHMTSDDNFLWKTSGGSGLRLNKNDFMGFVERVAAFNAGYYKEHYGSLGKVNKKITFSLSKYNNPNTSLF